jgi:hypothetical protein
VGPYRHRLAHRLAGRTNPGQPRLFIGDQTHRCRFGNVAAYVAVMPVEGCETSAHMKLPWRRDPCDDRSLRAGSPGSTKDRFDRVIAGQASLHNLAIATRDSEILDTALAAPCKPDLAASA